MSASRRPRRSSRRAGARPPPFHVRQDEEYRRQAEAEAAYYDRPRPLSVDTELPVTDAYWNERFTGDRNTFWYETIASYGTFERGCALGSGGLRQSRVVLEQNPSLRLTIYDISGESLALIERELGGQFPGRVATERVDLNFADLPEDAYDLIVSEGCLHHLTNLEHIAFQINRSLTADGYFFLRDYVGEARFQFAEEKKRLFEATFARAQERRPFLRSWRTVWPDEADWAHSPFEAVRSDETLGVLKRELDEVLLRSAGAVLGLLLFVRPAQQSASTAQAAARGSSWRRRLASAARKLAGRRTARVQDYSSALGALAEELFDLDRQLSETGHLRPTNAFAVYRRKRTGGS